MYSESDFRTAANGICPGPDLEWFGVDGDGRIAGFTNAGFASVPADVFSSYTLFCETLEFVSTLPQINTLDDWSQRGLFGYDWNHALGQPDPLLPYVLMTRPKVPIMIDSFPKDIAEYLRGIRIPECRFADCTRILV
jgi:hypothetical protein